MSDPYIGFGNDTLDKCAPAKAGDLVDCPTCGGKHELVDSSPPMLLFYKCGEKIFMGGLNGRLTMGVPADVKGSLES